MFIDLIEPAVKGTVGVLTSVDKYAPNVQRVVITSSVAAIMDVYKPTGTIFTEADWNTSSIKDVEEKGKGAGGGIIYMASKTLAEKAAWAYVENNKPKWDIATVNPPVVRLSMQVDPTKLTAFVVGLWSYITPGIQSRWSEYVGREIVQDYSF